MRSAADLLKSLVERKGIRVLLNANTARMHGETQVEGVELADGRRIEADAVIFAAGIRPNVALAKDAGIAVDRGIVVDDHLQTGVPDILCARRMRRASRHLLRPGRAGL